MSTCVDEDDTFPKGLGCHDLRHTSASLLIASSANFMQVQRQLGHARPYIPLDAYSHLFDTGLGEIGRKMGQVLDTHRNEGEKSGGLENENTP